MNYSQSDRNTQTQITSYRKDEIYAYVLAFLTFLPLKTSFNLLRVAVIGFLFLMKPYHGFRDLRVYSVAKRMVVSPVLPVIIVFLLEGDFSTSLVVHELMRMVYCALLIVTVSNLKVRFRCIYTICLIVFLPNFAIQVAQFLHIGSVTAFIRNNYLTSESGWSHLNLASRAGSDFRAGSIYINPNVYMVIPLLVLVVLLQQDMRKRSLPNYILIGCVVLSCYFTGSRTATVIIIIIMVLYIVKYAKQSNRVVLILFALIAFVLFGWDTVMESRSFALSFNRLSSLTAKLNGFVWYWTSSLDHVLYWFTGSIGSTSVASTDCELAHIYTWYGLFGIAWYIKYCRITLHYNPHIEFYSKPITYVCILVAVTASVLLCMPIFSFVCVILLSSILEPEYEE